MFTKQGAGLSATGIAEAINAGGASPVLLVCEHASNAIPAEFDALGLDAAALGSHIAWDPGALAVAQELSGLFDATLVAQRVSRLLYDCNRPPDSPSAVPVRSEIRDIPGNADLSDEARAARATQFYEPFRDLLTRTIDAHIASSPVIVSIHTFTPVYHGVRRDVELGILHDADARLADAMLAAAGTDGGLDVRRNEPYGPADGVTHTLREHALPRRLLNVMIEVRNDLVATPSSQEAMAQRLAGWLTAALAALGRSTRLDAMAGAGSRGGL